MSAVSFCPTPNVVALVLAGTLVYTAYGLITIWTQRVSVTADEWISKTPNGRVTDASLSSRNVVVQVEAPGRAPYVAELVKMLEGQVPNGVKVIVNSYVGEQLDAGVVGES
jgi:N-acetylmuramic acid 6-phosphate (MurNAc-6-P) etherase